MEAIPDPHGRSAKGCEKFFDDSELAHFWLSFTRIPADPQVRHVECPPSIQDVVPPCHAH
ncbi:hypothetical protein XACJK48_9710001 [Xanthomonas citri pv. citri]|nr:hypothetical protein XAC902_1960001 [Xanthomonas citri pv. citri]CEE30803.1 hypothetical protein XAC2911_1710006 [Xanthomonas citri pv. citri]CEF22237.1 hypothetical protein XACJK2_1650001 [Xanthomonas citri pv. citri]CEH61632.1 hypothetical protein XACJK48_9710001 [Xanthomonas citri pv. citri]